MHSESESPDPLLNVAAAYGSAPAPTPEEEAARAAFFLAENRVRLRRMTCLAAQNQSALERQLLLFEEAVREHERLKGTP